MTPITRICQEKVKVNGKTVIKEILMMKISEGNNTWVSANNDSEEEYHRLRKLFGYE